MKLFRIFFVITVCLVSFSSLMGYANSIGDIEMYFCDTTTGQDNKSLLLTGETKQAIPLCLSFYNKAATDTSILLNFVDGTITNDGSKKKACLEEGTKEMFGQYVTGIQTQKAYTIEGKQYLTLTGSIIFPDSYVGDLIGCVTYATNDQTTKEGSINVLVRKANIIMVSLSGEIRRILDFTPLSAGSFYDNNISNDPKVIIYRDDTGKYTLGFSLLNSGNITESTSLHGNISNTRGRSQDIDITDKEIAPSSQSDYTTTIDLPRYSAQYTLTLSGQSTPIFLLPDSQYHINTGTMSLSFMTIFTTPWDLAHKEMITISIIACLIISLILFSLIIWQRKKRRRTIKSVSKHSHTTKKNTVARRVIKKSAASTTKISKAKTTKAKPISKTSKKSV